MPEQQIDFGDYVQIEQLRFGVPNEMYVYKVVNTLESNTWVDVPATCGDKETIHSDYSDVVSCICCGICETEVMKYRICDVEKCVVNPLSLINECFVCKLRALCIAYDRKNGEYPEHAYEGIALFEFFLENGLVESHTPESKHHRRAWEEMLQRGRDER